jgi:hypothetical protein
MEFLVRRAGFVTALVATAVASTVPAIAQEARAHKPEHVAQLFCLARMADDDAPIRAMLTPDLAAAIASAEDKNAAIAAKTPDEKPPLGDGIPWQSFPDLADSCEAGTTSFMMDEATITVGYHFRSGQDADFTDILVLRQVEQASGRKLWRIDDIAYDTGDSLRDALALAFIAN